MEEERKRKKREREGQGTIERKRVHTVGQADRLYVTNRFTTL